VHLADNFIEVTKVYLKHRDACSTLTAIAQNHMHAFVVVKVSKPTEGHAKIEYVATGPYILNAKKRAHSGTSLTAGHRAVRGRVGAASQVSSPSQPAAAKSVVSMS
jgi:hypothetical protein